MSKQIEEAYAIQFDVVPMLPGMSKENAHKAGYHAGWNARDAVQPEAAQVERVELETVAKAMFNTSQMLAERVTPWNEAPKHDQEAWRIIARAAITAMAPQGVREGRKEYVHALVADYAGKPVEDSDLLTDGLGFDSLDLVEVAMDIESEYQIDPDPSAVEQWRTVEDVVDYSMIPTPGEQP